MSFKKLTEPVLVVTNLDERLTLKIIGILRVPFFLSPSLFFLGRLRLTAGPPRSYAETSRNCVQKNYLPSMARFFPCEK